MSHLDQVLGCNVALLVDITAQSLDRMVDLLTDVRWHMQTEIHAPHFIEWDAQLAVLGLYVQVLLHDGHAHDAAVVKANFDKALVV